MNLSVPNSDFTPNTPISSAQMDANFAAIVSWANGNIDYDNLDTLTGLVSWLNASTSASISINQSGVLASSTSSVKVSSNAAQVDGDALMYLALNAALSSIPTLKVDHAGIGSGGYISHSGVMASGNAALRVSATGASTAAKGAFFAEITNASATVPVIKGENTGSGPLLSLGTASVDKFEVNADGSMSKAAEPPSGNFLLNSDFDFWQRGTSTTIANSATGYLADRWYVKNSLGTDGVITFSRNATGHTGSKYAAQVQITTPPSALQANGCELYQTLENFDSRKLYNKTASFGVYVKALNNVTSVGIQFYSKTTEGKVDTTIGSEVVTTVDTSGFTLIKTEGIALGTAQTASGVIGVRIRIAGVSSGNTYDDDNGFIVSQAMLNIGSRLGNFVTRGATLGDELEMCQRFYEKSYALDTAPGTATDAGHRAGISSSTTAGTLLINVDLTEKRVVPTVTTYASTSGTSGSITEKATNTDVPGEVLSPGTSGFVIQNSDVISALIQHWVHFTADAEI